MSADRTEGWGGLINSPNAHYFREGRSPRRSVSKLQLGFEMKSKEWPLAVILCVASFAVLVTLGVWIHAAVVGDSVILMLLSIPLAMVSASFLGRFWMK